MQTIENIVLFELKSEMEAWLDTIRKHLAGPKGADYTALGGKQAVGGGNVIDMSAVGCKGGSVKFAKIWRVRAKGRRTFWKSAKFYSILDFQFLFFYFFGFWNHVDM